MSRRIAVIVALALLAIPSVFSFETSGSDGEMKGSGTEQDPFLVSSVADLKNIGKGKYSMTSSYRQINDITFTDDDALNKDDIIGLEIKIYNDKVKVNIFWNDEPLIMSSDGTDYIGITFNNEDKTLYADSNMDADITFEFSKNVLRVDEENIIILRGMSTLKNISFGFVTKFYDIPFETSECINGNFTPIGTETSPFSGKYDGGGFSIKNMKIVNISENMMGGLFGTIVNSEVSNVNLVSGNRQEELGYIISNKSKILLVAGSEPLSASLKSTSGGVVGIGKVSTLSNIKNENIVASYANILVKVDGDWINYAVGIDAETESSTGGIAGVFSGEISNCENRAYLLSTSYIGTKIGALSYFNYDDYLKRKDVVNNNSGGIVGKTDGYIEIERCSSVSKIMSISTMDSTDSFSNFNGPGKKSPDINLHYYHRIGGIAGYVDSAKIMNSFYIGSIQISSNIISIGPLEKYIVSKIAEFSGGIFGNVMDELYCSNCYSIENFKQAEIGITPTENKDKVSSEFIKRSGGIIGWFGGNTLEIKSSFSDAIFSDLNSDKIGGVIGYSSIENVSLIDVYYSRNGLAPIGGRSNLDIEKYSRIISSMSEEDYGESWDFERIWDIDEDTNLPVIRLRFYVQFVSDDPSLYEIIYLKRPAPEGFMVDDVRNGFRIELSDVSSRSVPYLLYDNGDSVTQHGDEFFTSIATDDSGTPADRVIVIKGISLNRYSVDVVSLPETVNVFVGIDGSAEHGSDVDITFTSDTYDVSRLTLAVSSKGSKVISRGEGVYTVTGITDDIEIVASGFAERPDLTFFVYMVAFACSAVAAAVLSGIVKLIRLRSHTRSNERFG